MRLLHHTDSTEFPPPSSIKSTPQGFKREDGRTERIDKPAGFWVSVEGPDDWAHWCTSESFGLGKRTFEVLLSPNANILCLNSALDIDLFTQEYGMGYPGLPRLSMSNPGIDWKRVAEKHQGIIITPYIWSRRLDGGASWYYGWDCASGCIWDAEAIAEIREIPDYVMEVSE